MDGDSKIIQNKNKFFFHTSAKKTTCFSFFFLLFLFFFFLTNKPVILRGEVNIFWREGGGLRSGEGDFQSSKTIDLKY